MPHLIEGNMTREEKVQYWLDVTAEDLDLGEFLCQSGRWLYAAFMCHQVIEKMLKAYWTATRDDVPHIYMSTSGWLKFADSTSR